MKSLPFKKIDAFTGLTSSGNPAGAVYLEKMEQLSPEDMQRIARECGGWVREVGFVCDLGRNKYWMRYFSSEREVEFCGHATLAISYDLFKSNETLLNAPAIEISTKDAELEAVNRIETDDAVFIKAPYPRRRDLRISAEECAQALRVGSSCSFEPKALINAGLETLIVQGDSLEEVVAVKPDIDELRDFCTAHAVDILLLYTSHVSTEGCSYRTRVFAPRFGYLEDPATGSGSSAFGYYLRETGRWTEGTLTLEQNASIRNPNLVKLAAINEDGDHQRVLFGGRATVRLVGRYLLPQKT